MVQHLFTAKLQEIEEEYCRMKDRLKVCQQKDREELETELEKIKEECMKSNIDLEKAAQNSHFAYSSEMARTQLLYKRRLELDIHRMIVNYNDSEEKAEAMALYAEYAMDFAKYAANYALMATMLAIDMQMRVEEEQK